MTRPLDHDYLEELIDRLGRIPPDAKPAWGSLTPRMLCAHLADTVRFSMGKQGHVPGRGGWFTRNILGPLIMHGMLKIPRNIRGSDPGKWPPADIETLHALLEEYLNLVQADELVPPPHPAFGDIGVDGWARMHVVHFEHHLRQFGV